MKTMVAAVLVVAGLVLAPAAHADRCTRTPTSRGYTVLCYQDRGWTVTNCDALGDNCNTLTYGQG